MTQTSIMLSIIVINYKSEDIIEKCLRSVACRSSYEIIVIDNQNNSRLMALLSQLPHVSIIPYAGNLGFSGANNVGIRRSEGKYVLTLNADVFLTPDYIDHCLAFLEAHPDFSSIQGKLLLHQHRDRIDSTGNAITRTRLGYNEYHREKDRVTPSKEIFGACAAASIYRRTALEEIQINGEYFDNDFFAYLEDLDLDWRLRLMGGKSYFLNTAVAYHIREFSTKSGFRMRQSLRNRLYMIIKNDAAAYMWVNIIFCLFAFLFISGSGNNYRLIFKMLKKRKYIQSQRRVAHQQIKPLFQKTPWLKYFQKVFSRS